MMISQPGGSPRETSCLVDRETSLRSMAYFTNFFWTRRFSLGRTAAKQSYRPKVLYCSLVCPVLLQRSGHSVHCLTAIETAMSPDTIDGAGESSCGDSAGNRETCRYLDTVSKLERLTGFEPPAEAFATAATESSGPGCRFEPLCKALDSSHEPHHPTPGCV